MPYTEPRAYIYFLVERRFVADGGASLLADMRRPDGIRSLASDAGSRTVTPSHDTRPLDEERIYLHTYVYVVRCTTS